MNNLLSVVSVVTLLLIAQCNFPSANNDPTLVTSLHFSPSAFDSFKRNTEMRYTLRSPATVSIYIVKRDSAQNELLVKTLVKSLTETKGSHSITWIGDTDQHLFAPVDIYFGVVETSHSRFETIIQVFHF